MLFLMISTSKSQSLTLPSVRSLLKNTTFGAKDKVVVIDNDGSLEPIAGVTIVRHERPRSFAENANIGIDLSQVLQDDLILLNNDIIFTKGWTDFLVRDTSDILIPFCNQNVLYGFGALQLTFTMDLADYGDREEELEQIASGHRRDALEEKYSETSLLMSFFCVFIPWRTSKLIGHFDERFGRGGGEDVDYRLRALKAGINVHYARRCYLLHFMGKSTWRSGEAAVDTQAADVKYRNFFVEKWGLPLAEFFLAGPDKLAVATRYGVLPALERHDFKAILDRLEGTVQAVPA